MSTATAPAPTTAPAPPSGGNVWHICGRGQRHDCETHPHRCRAYCGILMRRPRVLYPGRGWPHKKNRCSVCFALAEAEGLF